MRKCFLAICAVIGAGAFLLPGPARAYQGGALRPHSHLNTSSGGTLNNLTLGGTLTVPDLRVTSITITNAVLISTGHLEVATLTVTTATVTGDTFRVGTSTFIVSNGLIGIGVSPSGASKIETQDAFNTGTHLQSSTTLSGTAARWILTGQGGRSYFIQANSGSGGFSIGENNSGTVFFSALPDAGGGLPAHIGIQGSATAASELVLGSNNGPIRLQSPANFTQPVMITATATLTGVSDASNAATGRIGEFLSSTMGTASAPQASTVYLNLSTLTLTAGDWEISATCGLNTGGTSAISQEICAISNTSDALDQSNLNNFFVYSASALVVSTGYANTLGPRRVSISGTTTYYLVGRLTYTTLGGATWNTNTTMQARRIR